MSRRGDRPLNLIRKKAKPLTPVKIKNALPTPKPSFHTPTGVGPFACGAVKVMDRHYLNAEQIKQRQAAFAKMPSYQVPVGLTPGGSASIKQYCPPAYNQGSLDSCTANAFCMAYRILNIIGQTADATFLPSRLYIYYKERLLMYNDDAALIKDTGGVVPDACAWAKKNGICSESSWPYIASQVNVAPPAICDVEATTHKITGYSSLVNGSTLVNTFRTALTNSQPIMLAFFVYSSFESAAALSTGVVPMPTSKDALLGGHEVVVVGYTDSSSLFTCLNCWGPTWGKNGYFYLPYAYVATPKYIMGSTIMTI